MSYKSFNSTGRDDSTTEIIRPKGEGRRKLIFVAIAIVGAVLLCLYGFSQTGLNPFAPAKEGSHGLDRGSVDVGNPKD